MSDQPTAAPGTCPECGHACRPHETGSVDRCGACGLYFSKWREIHGTAAGGSSAPVKRVSGVDDSWRSEEADDAGLMGLLLAMPERIDRVDVAARAIAWVLLAAWGLWFIGLDYTEESGPIRAVNESFLHRVDLVFHEAGHIIFMLFGDFMATLGGTLMQLIMPCAVMLTFLLKYANAFGASVGAWWLGQSMIDVAPYIADAERQEMLLLGGVTGSDRPGYHDWNNILGRLDALDAAQGLGALVDTTGELLIIASLVWGALLLWRQWQALTS